MVLKKVFFSSLVDFGGFFSGPSVVFTICYKKNEKKDSTAYELGSRSEETKGLQKYGGFHIKRRRSKERGGSGFQKVAAYSLHTQVNPKNLLLGGTVSLSTLSPLPPPKNKNGEPHPLDVYRVQVLAVLLYLTIQFGVRSGRRRGGGGRRTRRFLPLHLIVNTFTYSNTASNNNNEKNQTLSPLLPPSLLNICWVLLPSFFLLLLAASLCLQSPILY